MRTERVSHRLVIPDEYAGRRIDQTLAALLPEFSRSRLKAWIESGAVRVAGLTVRPRDAVQGGDVVALEAEIESATAVEPERIPLAIRYEDAHVLVIDKRPGLVVHPGAGNRAGTLQNALLSYDPSLASLPRAGIVHRLDKDTGGLMVVARSQAAHTALTRAIEARAVEREYEAICTGVLTAGGTVSAPIGRHRIDRTRMTVREDGRPAVTHYRVIERFRNHTHVWLKLETGRTHQIRVHMAHVRHPLVGDRTYGGRLLLPRQATPALVDALRGFHRQALHAARLAFDHPVTAQRIDIASPVPPDFAALLAALAADAAREVPS